MSEIWLSELTTKTPPQGYDLIVKMTRVAVKITQPDTAIRGKLRAIYERDANALIAASAVVATHFKTVVAANHYWRDL